ncbi:hypothetical protein MaudCBS49596_008045, partial [Microsporum audouinii]
MVDGTPPWIQAFLEQQSNLAQRQNKQIQQQGEQLRALTERLQHIGSPDNLPILTPSRTPPPLPPSTTERLPRARIPDPEKFDGKDTTNYPAWLADIKAKLTIDRGAI